LIDSYQSPISEKPKNKIQYPVKDLNPISKEIPGCKIQYQSTSILILEKPFDHNVKALIQLSEKPTTKELYPKSA